MAQKIDIKLWLSTNAAKVTGKVKKAVSGLKDKFGDATGTVIEMGSRLESLESVGAKSVGSISEALNGLMAGGVIGLISSGVVLLVQNLVEAKKAAEELTQEMAEGFAAAVEKIGAVGRRVRLEALTEDLDHAIKSADKLTGKLEAIREEREIAAGIEQDKLSGAHVAAVGRLESERLRLRSINPDAETRQIIDLDSAAERAKLEAREEERLAELAVESAKKSLALKREEQETNERRIALVKEELQELIAQERLQRSVEMKKAVRGLQSRAEDQIAKYEEQRQKAYMDSWRAEAELARATLHLAQVREDGSNKVYAASMATADALAAQKKAADDKAQADRKAQADQRLAELKEKRDAARKAVEDARRAVDAIPAQVKGERVRSWISRRKAEKQALEDEGRDRERASRRMKYLQSKQANSLYRGRLTRAQREELANLQAFFGKDKKGKDAVAKLDETNKELRAIQKVLADAMKVN